MARTERIDIEENRYLIVQALTIEAYEEYDQLMDKATKTRQLEVDPELPDVTNPERRGWIYTLRALRLAIKQTGGVNKEELSKELTPGEALRIARTVTKLSMLQEDERKNSTSSSPT